VSVGDPGLERLVASLDARGLAGARVALVLGSGLGAFAERLEEPRRIPYAELEGLPASAVSGHAGALVAGRVGAVPVLVQQGRVHLSEGRSAREVTRAVRAFAALGVERLVLTNAAGGLRPEWPSGTLMRLTDHLNLQGETPLVTGEGGYGSPYDEALGSALDEAAVEAGVALERGVYAGLPGPSYETPAEIRLLRTLGADAVGMSTVLEALAGHAAGLRVVAISLITNPAAGLSRGPLSHAEVVAAGAAAGERFGALLAAAVPRLAAAGL
jgi:purine-nucleoside phosphorylase